MPTKLAPGIGDLIKIMVERYKAKTKRHRRAAALLDGLQPDLDAAQQRAAGRQGEVRRLRPRGGAQGRARRRHSGGRHHPGLRREVLPARARRCPGQNERSTPVVMQNAGEHISVVWPTEIRTQDPVLPLPEVHRVYADL